MRSKRSIITISRYNAVTFDLIRSGLGRTTFPQGKAILRTAGRFSGNPRLHPLSLPIRADSSPYTGELFPVSGAVIGLPDVNFLQIIRKWGSGVENRLEKTGTLLYNESV